MTLNIVDAGCGVGKTTSMINFINESSNNTKFLYITPLLTEVSRIENSCSFKKFIQPNERPSKTENLLRLIDNGENIISTHALFKKMTDQVLDLTKFHDYTLIMDEVADVIEEIEISRDDLKTILKEYASIQDDNSLYWYATDYEGRFEDYKNMIEMGGVIANRSDSGEVISIVWMFPFKIFESFKDVYILTYLFNGQKSYYEYYNANIKYLYIKNFHLTEEEQKYNYDEQKKLITICDDEKINMIGDTRGALSVSWFQRNKNNDLMATLKNNIYNFFRNKMNTPISLNLWTTFKEFEDTLKGKGYTKSFAPINMRATNDYKDTCAVAYIANRYMKPTLKHFFEKQGLSVDEETYALSELIQFIYRSAIRDGKPITVYIPSKRMRDLLKNWINKKDD